VGRALTDRFPRLARANANKHAKHCKNAVFARVLFLRERQNYFPWQKKNYENCGWEAIFPCFCCLRLAKSTCPVSAFIRRLFSQSANNAKKSARLPIVRTSCGGPMSLSTLEKWYSGRCNGDWEHSFGVEISTLDNPGWSVEIDLHDTGKQKTTFERIRIDRSPNDWIQYWAEKEKFQIRCGPLNLSEAIAIFARWFDSL
jgi:hypothetical protein